MGQKIPQKWDFNGNFNGILMGILTIYGKKKRAQNEIKMGQNSPKIGIFTGILTGILTGF